MSKTDYLKLYIQDLIRNYSKSSTIDLSDEETKTWFRHTLSEIDLLIHDRVRELVTTNDQETESTFNLDDAEINMLRSYRPQQERSKSLFKRLLSVEEHHR